MIWNIDWRTLLVLLRSTKIVSSVSTQRVWDAAKESVHSCTFRCQDYLEVRPGLANNVAASESHDVVNQSWSDVER